MKKISTLFKKDPNDLGRVIPELDPANKWVYDEGVRATRKWDGSACVIINGNLYKRYDVKKGRSVPAGAIPCQEPDAITGHWPHWLLVDSSKSEDKFFIEAHQNLIDDSNGVEDGTYELCGPKVQGNPEKFNKHVLVRHGISWVDVPLIHFQTIKELLGILDIEGIVFHHPDGRMCKIRKSDFGIKRDN
jgi:hypothetical protein